MKYFGNWNSYEEMIDDWGAITKQPIPKDHEVLFASYGTENYEGDAIVVFEYNDKLYEVNGGHCSCYGLAEESYAGETESQWDPEETSWAALKMRELDTEQHTEDAIAAFKKLLAAKS
jgi:hypothetical protein